MKIITILLILILGVLNMSASGYAEEKRISVNLSNGTFYELISQIEKQSEFMFFYNSDEIDNNLRVNIKANNKLVTDILNEVMKENNLAYKISNKHIIITQKEKEKDQPQDIIKNKINVTGTVVDKEGPLIGVVISVRGTSIGSVTDNSGSFNLKNVNRNDTVEFSYLGYETLLLLAKDIPQEVKLTLQSIQLSGVIITAQAIGQKQAITKQINSYTLKNVISAEKLQQNPDINTVEAIGRLPGIAVNRVGGEGAGFTLRGLDQAYTKVLINGEPLPVNLNTISTYSLQGVEVFKTLTANQEGDAVAGTVDLTIRAIPKGLHYNIIAQSGYNELNNDFKNYNFVGQFSNRFIKDKLGLSITLNADRVNRSTSLQTTGFNTNYTTNMEDPFYINTIVLNINERINYKQSAMISLDYIASNSTLLNLQSFLSASNTRSSTQSKSFNPEGSTATVPIYVNMNEMPSNHNYGVTNIFSGRTKFNFLNSTLNYGISYAFSKNDAPGTRSWFYTCETRADGMHYEDLKTATAEDIVPKFESILRNLSGTRLETMNFDKTESENWNLTPRIDYEIPFKFGNNGLIHGKVQVGAKYRYSRSKSDRTSGMGHAGGNAYFGDFVAEKFGFESRKAELLVTGQENNFMRGKYMYGDVYSFRLNNEIFDAWQQNGKEAFEGGSDIYDPRYTGFTYNMKQSAMSDRNDKHHYVAGYIMPEINIGSWLMLLPGFRYEYNRSDMRGYRGFELTNSFSIYENLQEVYNLKDTLTTREDKFFLPMLHVRVKPVSWFYTHFSYTHSLRRPSEGVHPFEYYSTQNPSTYSYSSGNPGLKSELWKSYDLQLTFHDDKYGLFSITGFRKTVKDKLWSRAYKRIASDPIPHPVFKQNDLVDMVVYENHPYEIKLKGVEVELQTSFGYLPKPLSYLTLSVNYTYTKGSSPNPYTELYTYVPEGSRYPITGRRDSVVVEPMTGMPKHIVNVTLGVEVKAFRSYLSYQFTTDKIQTTHPNDLRQYVMSEPYNRLDFNASYRFELKNRSLLEILLKVGNITNSEDRIKYRGDPRPINIEQYGVTADIGLRYEF